MTIGARTAAWSGERQPYDAEVEWIGANSGPYIDTGVKANSELVIDIMYYGGTDQDNIISGGDSWTVNIVQFADKSRNNRWQLAWGMTFSENGPYETETNAKIDKGVLYVNGTRIITINYFEWESNSTLALFATNRGGVVSEISQTAKIGTCKITKDADVLIDLIPVRFTNENGVSEGAMYDKVSKSLFRNAGTGAFIVGPDVSAANGGGIS